MAGRSPGRCDDISSELKSGVKGGVEVDSIPVTFFLKFNCLDRLGEMDDFGFLTAPCRLMPEPGGVRTRSTGMAGLASEDGSCEVPSEFVFSCDWCTRSLVALASLRRSRMPLLIESPEGGIAAIEELEACAVELFGLISLGMTGLP